MHDVRNRPDPIVQFIRIRICIHLQIHIRINWTIERELQKVLACLKEQSNGPIFTQNISIYLYVQFCMMLKFLKFLQSRVITLTFSSKYRAVGKEFLTKMHLFFYKDRSEYAMKVTVLNISVYLFQPLILLLKFCVQTRSVMTDDFKDAGMSCFPSYCRIDTEGKPEHERSLQAEANRKIASPNTLLMLGDGYVWSRS